jgi:two-component system cell cycle sensor histidine kinase PleC
VKAVKPHHVEGASGAQTAGTGGALAPQSAILIPPVCDPGFDDLADLLAAAAALCGAAALAMRPADPEFGAAGHWAAEPLLAGGEAGRRCLTALDAAAAGAEPCAARIDGDDVVAIPIRAPDEPRIVLGWLAAQGGADRPPPTPAALERAARLIAPAYALGRERALRQAAGARVSRLLRHHGDVFVEMDRAGRILRVDASVSRVLGVGEAALTGRRWTQAAAILGARASRPDLRALVAAARAGRPLLGQPVQLRYPGGAARTFEISVEPAGGAGGAIAAVRDLTPAREAAAVGERAAARLIEGLEVVSGGFALFDRAGRLVLANRAYRDQLAALGDFPPDQPITMLEIVSRGVDRCVYLNDSADGGRDARIDRRMQRFWRADGRAYEQSTMDGRHWEVAERRTLAGDVAVFRVDVTDRKLAEQRLRDAIECLPLGFAMFDPQDRFVLCNARYRDFYPELVQHLRPGVSFRHLCEICFDDIDAGRGEDRDAWIERRLANHRGGGPFVMTTTEGRSVLVCESRTMEGGYVAAHVDISAQRMLQDQLAHQTERAEAALRARSEFLANLSHEMRTPLNAVIGFADMIAMGARGPIDPAYADLAGMIRQSGNFMLSLIVDILDMSRIEAGRMPLNREEVHAAEAAAEAAMMLTPQARAKGLWIDAAVPADLPPVWAERRRLVQMLQNLLSNAVKFTSSGGVRVGAHVEGGRLHIVVADTGRGMTAAEIEIAMTPFAQVAGRDMIDGSGLGLPLVKAMAEMQDGDLHIRSEPGRGTEVIVCLPLARPAAPRMT